MATVSIVAGGEVTGGPTNTNGNDFTLTAGRIVINPGNDIQIGDGNIILTATGIGENLDDGDIIIGANLSSATGDIRLTADDDIVFQSAGKIESTALVRLTANNGESNTNRGIFELDNQTEPGTADEDVEIMAGDLVLVVNGENGFIGQGQNPDNDIAVDNTNFIEIDVTSSLSVEALGSGSLNLADINNLSLSSATEVVGGIQGGLRGGSSNVRISAGGEFNTGTIETSGDVMITTTGDIGLGRIETLGTVILIASGDINDEFEDDEDIDVLGGEIQLTAGEGIGNVARLELESDVDSLGEFSVENSQGEINLLLLTNSGKSSNISISNGSGDILLEQKGDETLTVVSASTTNGDITISNNGDQISDVLDIGDISTNGTGNINLKSLIRGNIEINGNVTAESSIITVEAADNTLLNSNNGISSIGGTVNITSQNGSIQSTRDQDSIPEIVADTIELTTQNGAIGTDSNHLETRTSGSTITAVSLETIFIDNFTNQNTTINLKTSGEDASINFTQNAIEGTAIAGNVTVENATSDNGNIVLKTNDSADLIVNTISASNGAVNLEIDGSISDRNDPLDNITTNSLTIAEANGIGTAENKINTNISTLTLRNIRGDTFIENSDGLSIAKADSSISGSLEILSQGPLSVDGEVVTVGTNGSISLEAQGENGNITINSDVEANGSIEIIAAGAVETADLAQIRTSLEGGSIRILSQGSLSVDGQILAEGINGSINLETQGENENIRIRSLVEATRSIELKSRGDIENSETGQIQTSMANGFIRIEATNLIQNGTIVNALELGNLDEVVLNVSGAITDTTGKDTKITSSKLIIEDAVDIGMVNDLEDENDGWLNIKVEKLEIGPSVRGVVFLLEENDIEITSAEISQISENELGNLILYTERENSGTISVGAIEVGQGAVTLNASGSVVDATNEDAVDISAKTIRLTSVQGIGNDGKRLELDSEIFSGETTGTGSAIIDVRSESSLGTTVMSLQTAGEEASIVFTQIGEGELSLENISSSGGAEIQVTATANILVDSVISAGETGSITIDSGNSIEELSLDPGADLAASEIVLTAVNGIGKLDPLETSTGTIEASASGLIGADINFNNLGTDEVTLKNINTENGSIAITTDGPVLVQNLQAVSGGNNASNSVSITTTEGDIRLGDEMNPEQASVHADSEVSLKVAGNIVDLNTNGGTSIIAGGDISLDSTGEIGETSNQLGVNSGGSLSLRFSGSSLQGSIWANLRGLAGGSLSGDDVEFVGNTKEPPGLIFWNGNILGGGNENLRQFTRAETFYNEVRNLTPTQAVLVPAFFRHVSVSMNELWKIPTIEHINVGGGFIFGLPREMDLPSSSNVLRTQDNSYRWDTLPKKKKGKDLSFRPH